MGQCHRIRQKKGLGYGNKSGTNNDIVNIPKPINYIFYNVIDGDFSDESRAVFRFEVGRMRNIRYVIDDIRNRNTVTSRLAVSFGIIVAKGTYANLDEARAALIGTKYIYKLATPEVIELDYNEIKTFYPFTQIYTTGSELSPELDVTVRVME